MTFATLPHSASRRAGAAAARPAGTVSPRLARTLLAGAVLSAGVAGWLSTDPVSAAQAAARAGEDLTRLLRAMAAIKMVLAAAVLAGMWWRMATPTPAGRLAAYVAAAAAMSAGPVMIWGIAQVAVGALVLHAGLITGLVVLWRDPDVTRRIAGIVDGRTRGRLRVAGR
jgi:hypothetical protein